MDAPITCPECPATFPDEDGMWAHVRDVHEPHMDWPPPRHRADGPPDE